MCTAVWTIVLEQSFVSLPDYARKRSVWESKEIYLMGAEQIQNLAAPSLF